LGDSRVDIGFTTLIGVRVGLFAGEEMRKESPGPGPKAQIKGLLRKMREEIRPSVTRHKMQRLPIREQAESSAYS